MDKLTVSSSPHFFHSDTTQGIMLDVIIALLPTALAGVLVFGIRAALTMIVCIVCAVLAEYLWCLLVKKPISIGDFSAVVTGLLLGLNLTSALPLWMSALGSAIAIIVVKQFFGGLGQNFVNPAITARIILLVSFPKFMSVYYEPFSDIVSSATPLGGAAVPLKNLLLGGHSGCIGEGFPLLLLAGGLYLVIRRVISPAIPLTFIISAALLMLILTGSPNAAVRAVFSGGLILAAVFMATDYTTSPYTFWGKVIFGTGCGIITVIIRQFGSLPEGVSYALLLMNILVPHINKLTLPKPFGYKEGKQHA